MANLLTADTAVVGNLIAGTNKGGGFVEAKGRTGATAGARFVGATTSGAPLTGTFKVGDFIIDQTGSIYVCTVAGTPGTWVAGLAGPTASVTTLAVSGATVLGTTVVNTPHVVAALAIDVTAGVVFTKSVSTDSTFTASAAGTAGQSIELIISVDGTQRVITFGSNLNSSGTLTIPASKIGTITFRSDGTAFRETGRAILT